MEVQKLRVADVKALFEESTGLTVERIVVHSAFGRHEGEPDEIVEVSRKLSAVVDLDLADLVTGAGTQTS